MYFQFKLLSDIFCTSFSCSWTVFSLDLFQLFRNLLTNTTLYQFSLLFLVIFWSNVQKSFVKPTWRKHSIITEVLMSCKPLIHFLQSFIISMNHGFISMIWNEWIQFAQHCYLESLSFPSGCSWYPLQKSVVCLFFSI